MELEFAVDHHARIGAINIDGTNVACYAIGLTSAPVSIVVGPDGDL